MIWKNISASTEKPGRDHRGTVVLPDTELYIPVCAPDETCTAHQLPYNINIPGRQRGKKLSADRLLLEPDQFNGIHERKNIMHQDQAELDLRL